MLELEKCANRAPFGDVEKISEKWLLLPRATIREGERGA